MAGTSRTAYRRRRAALIGSGMLALVILLAFASDAMAIKRGRLATQVTPSGSFTPATYTFTSYKLAKNDVCTGYRIQFPAGTDVAGATCVDGSVSVNAGTRTVTVAYSSPISGNNVALPVRLGGIVNPGAGTYNVGNVTFLMSSNPPTDPQPTANYTIFGSPYLVMTIETPDDTQTVDFGFVDPGVTSPAKTVTITVDASSVSTLTRSVSGDGALMGLAVTGAATRTQPAGVTVYGDQFTVTPPYTSPPEIPYAAQILYTVIM